MVCVWAIRRFLFSLMILPNAYRAHGEDAAAAYFLLNLGINKPLPCRSSPSSVSSTHHPSPRKLSGLISALFSCYCRSCSSSLHFLLSEDLPGALHFVPPIRCQLPTALPCSLLPALQHFHLAREGKPSLKQQLAKNCWNGAVHPSVWISAFSLIEKCNFGGFCCSGSSWYWI